MQSRVRFAPLPVCHQSWRGQDGRVRLVYERAPDSDLLHVCCESQPAVAAPTTSSAGLGASATSSRRQRAVLPRQLDSVGVWGVPRKLGENSLTQLGVCARACSQEGHRLHLLYCG